MTIGNPSEFGALLDHAPDAVFLARPNGTILYANPAACILFGYTLEEFRKLGTSGMVNLADGRLSGILEKRRKTGHVTGVLKMVRKDDTRFSAEISSAEFTDSKGEQRTTVFVRDITEREHRERAIQIVKLKPRSKKKKRSFVKFIIA